MATCPSSPPTFRGASLRRAAICALALASLLSLALPGSAAETDARLAAVTAKLRQAWPQLEVTTVAPSPIAGLYEMAVGMQLYYVSADGSRLIVGGNILDSESRQSLSEPTRVALVARTLSPLGRKQALVFQGSKSGRHKSKRWLAVFTDVSCGYCARLHREIGEIIRDGIDVRYFLYPRAGLNSDAARQMESAWCSADPRRDLTASKAGRRLPPRSCDNPIAEHFRMGQELEIQGTPYIFLDNGKAIPGYVSAKNLRNLIGEAPPILQN